MDIKTLEILTQIATPLFLFILGIAAAVIAFFLRKLDRSIDTRFNKIDEKVDRVERDFMQFKADLPRNFVLRDDYIRVITVLENKIDDLGKDIKNLIKRIGESHG